MTAKLLNVIHVPDVPFKNVKPPDSMSARYKMGSKMADMCQNLGFASGTGSDLGYQTFLYSNENDLRSVLMFLIDKLPKEQGPDISEDQELGKK